MASILNSPSAWQSTQVQSQSGQNILAQQATPGAQPAQNQQMNPLDAANKLVQQIMGSQDPNQAFTQMLQANPQAQQVMALINQYGNGDPKAGLMNYAASLGQQAVAQQVAHNFGLV